MTVRFPLQVTPVNTTWLILTRDRHAGMAQEADTANLKILQALLVLLFPLFLSSESAGPRLTFLQSNSPCAFFLCRERSYRCIACYASCISPSCERASAAVATGSAAVVNPNALATSRLACSWSPAEEEEGETSS